MPTPRPLLAAVMAVATLAVPLNPAHAAPDASAAAASPAPSPSIAAAIANPDRPGDQTARDATRHPAELLALANLHPGDHVVDFMAGKGYFTWLFASLVGPGGKVTTFEPAEFDVWEKAHMPPAPSGKVPPPPPPPAPMPAGVRRQVKPLATLDDAGPADLIWTSQNYHDIFAFLGKDATNILNRAAFRALKPGGRYIVIDHSGPGRTDPKAVEAVHRIDERLVRRQVRAAGFKLVSTSDVLRNPADTHDKSVFDPAIRGNTDQFVLVFRKPK